MKKQIIYGLHAVLAAITHSPQNICELFIARERNDDRIEKIILLAETNGIKPQFIARKKLQERYVDIAHQGVVAIVSEEEQLTEKDLSILLDKAQKPIFLLILDSIQDPHNLGACLRTANAANVDAVITTKDKAAGLTPVVRKVASGAAEVTPFIQVTNLARTMRMLKERGIWLYGADANAEKTIYQTDLKGNIAIIMGAEGSGLRTLTQTNCDYLMKIPMQGTVTSLNVSVATGICLFEANRQRSK